MWEPLPLLKGIISVTDRKALTALLDTRIKQRDEFLVQHGIIEQEKCTTDINNKLQNGWQIKRRKLILS